jgi:phage head maturation protease
MFDTLRAAVAEADDEERSDDEYGELRRGNGFATRAYDFEIRSVGEHGRTLEGHVAVFRSVARIPDRNGEFDEEIHPGIFDRYLTDRGFPVMQFDHGKDPRTGTVPIGVYDVFEPDVKGYHVRGRLFDNEVVEPVRQAIEGRAIKGMSWKMHSSKTGDRWTTTSAASTNATSSTPTYPKPGRLCSPPTAVRLSPSARCGLRSTPKNRTSCATSRAYPQTSPGSRPRGVAAAVTPM